MKRSIKKITLITVSVALLILVAVGTTIAYIIADTDSVQNIFSPSKVSCAVLENGDATGKVGNIVETDTKTDVKIKNTGNTDAYIRAAVVVNWMNKDGSTVLATKPVLGTDYSIDWAFDDDEDPTAWVMGSDGYYYFQNSVAANGGVTGTLINEVIVQKNAPPEGYYLSVEIVASAIQATSDAVKNWSGDVATAATDGGALTVKTQNN